MVWVVLLDVVVLSLVLCLLLALLMCFCSVTSIAALGAGCRLVFSLLFWWLLLCFVVCFLFGVLVVFAGLLMRRCFLCLGVWIAL